MGARANERRRTNIEQLNGLLRGELSAVETYRMALERLDPSSPSRAHLETCRLSHAQRVLALKQRIEKLGGQPEPCPGAWGVFAKAVEGGAALFGDRMAVSALEQGEDHGLSDYRDTDKLTAECRLVVSTQLLPAQLETHRLMNELRRQLKNN